MSMNIERAISREVHEGKFSNCLLGNVVTGNDVESYPI